MVFDLSGQEKARESFLNNLRRVQEGCAAPADLIKGIYPHCDPQGVLTELMAGRKLALPPVYIKNVCSASVWRHGRIEIIPANIAIGDLAEAAAFTQILWRNLLIPCEHIKTAKLYLCDPRDGRVVLEIVFSWRAWEEIKGLSSDCKSDLINETLIAITRDKFIVRELACRKENWTVPKYFHCSLCGSPLEGFDCTGCRAGFEFDRRDFTEPRYQTMGHLPLRIRDFIQKECGFKFKSKAFAGRIFPDS
jgi:hypothetical protein